jgi:hypothetical protein
VPLTCPAETVPPVTSYGHAAFVAIVSLFVVWKVVQETRGRSLESMDDAYSGVPAPV